MKLFQRLKQRMQRIRDQSEDGGTLSLADVWGIGYDPYEGRGNISKGLMLSPVAAAHRILTNSVGNLPLGLYRNVEGHRERVDTHGTLLTLKGRANTGMTPFMWQKTMMSDCFWHGEAFSRPIYDRTGKLLELRHYRADRVGREELLDGTVCYTLTEKDGSSNVYFPEEIIHFVFDSIDGEEGFGMLDMAKQTIRTDLNAQIYSEKFYTNGARLSGILKTDGKLSPEAKGVVRKAFMKFTSGAKNAYTVAVLDQGLSYTPLGISQADAQFIESRNFTVEEISRFTGIPQYKLQAGKQSYQSNEQQGIEYVVNTLQPIVTQWEQELTYKLLTHREREAGLYYRFNLEAEMRGDSKSRAEFYQTMVDHGIYLIDECRALEELEPLAEGMGKTPFVSKNLDSIENILKSRKEEGGEKT